MHNFLSHFQDVKPRPARQDKWDCTCPVHGTGKHKQNLGIWLTDGNKILMHCLSGCKTDDILDRIGLKRRDMFLDKKEYKERCPSVKPPPPVVYEYRTEEGYLSYRVTISKNLEGEKKTYCESLDDHDKWVTSMEHVDRLLYRLPELLSSEKDKHVFICEGEKDVETLRALGYIATTNSGGASTWPKAHNEYFRDRRVIICEDNDQAGRDRTDKLKENLDGIAAHVSVLRFDFLPEKNDVTDFFEWGHTQDEFEKLIEGVKPKSETFKISTVPTDDEIQPIKWIIQDILIENTCVILAAEEKTGKTWMLLYMSLCIANNIKYFSKFQVENSGPVLIYSPESSIINHRMRLWKLCLSMGIHPRKSTNNIHFIDQTEKIILGDDLSMKKLKNSIELIKPKVLIIDPLICALGSTDENSSNEMQESLTSLKALITPNNSLIIVLAHHLGKANKDRSAFHGLRGSSAIGAWADSRITLKKVTNKEQPGVAVDDARARRRCDIEHRDSLASAGFEWDLVDNDIPSIEIQKRYNIPCWIRPTELKPVSYDTQKTDREIWFEDLVDSVREFLSTNIDITQSERRLFALYLESENSIKCGLTTWQKVMKVKDIFPITS